MTTQKQSPEKPKRNIKPPPPGPGRPKGVPNKITTDVRQMVLAALEGVGGQEYLQRQATANPNAFLSLVAKTMPTKIVGDPEQPVSINITAQLVGDLSSAIKAGLSGGK